MNKRCQIGVLVLFILFICTVSACTQINRPINNYENTSNISENNTANSNTQNTQKITSPAETETVSVEDNTTTTIMQSDAKTLEDTDFEIKYKSFSIKENTNVFDIIDKLGLPEDYDASNNGFISGNALYRRWNLCYPDYTTPEIRVIVLSKVEYEGEETKDGESYIVGAYLELIETNKGLKVGDTLEKVLEVYGRPESFQKDIDNVDGLYFLRYTRGEKHLDITLNKDMTKVEYIFMDYNMEKSIKDQDNSAQ